MKNKNQNLTMPKGAEQPLYYYIMLTALTIAMLTINTAAYMPDQTKINATIQKPNQNQDLSTPANHATMEKTARERMLAAIPAAEKEFGLPDGLLMGIANAESTLGTKFYNPRDRNCNNWFGLKGGNTKLRIKHENSWLRCFTTPEGGARTAAKTLKLYYLAEGRNTPESIADKWVGPNQSQYHQQWVKNVNKHYHATPKQITKE